MRIRLDSEEITVVLGHQDLGMGVLAAAGFENRSQTGNVDPQRVLFAVGFISPQLLEEMIGGHHPVGVKEEKGQQGPLLVRTDLERFAIPENLERPKDAEFH